MNIEQKFNELAEQWKKETVNSSSIEQTSMHPAYQQIIGLGPKVIPLILKDLKKKVNFWFWALRALTREDPTTEDMKGDIILIRFTWIQWGRKKGYIKEGYGNE